MSDFSARWVFDETLDKDDIAHLFDCYEKFSEINPSELYLERNNGFANPEEWNHDRWITLMGCQRHRGMYVVDWPHSGITKIGITSDYNIRLKQLQRLYSGQAWLTACHPCPTRSFERLVLDGVQHKGGILEHGQEWFKYEPGHSDPREIPASRISILCCLRYGFTPVARPIGMSEVTMAEIVDTLARAFGTCDSVMADELDRHNRIHYEVPE